MFNAFKVYSDILYYKNKCIVNVEKYNKISTEYYNLFITNQVGSNYRAAIEFFRLGASYFDIAKYYKPQVSLAHTNILEAWRTYYL